MISLNQVIAILTLLWIPLAQADVADECHICGTTDGVPNQIQNPLGTFVLVLDGERQQNNCKRWQDITGKNPRAIDFEYCRDVVWKIAMFNCGCITPDGMTNLLDIYAPTVAPFEPRPTGPLPGRNFRTDFPTYTPGEPTPTPHWTVIRTTRKIHQSSGSSSIFSTSMMWTAAVGSMMIGLLGYLVVA